MRKLFASEWVTLDGVFDADTMEEWFNPYHSDERAEYITDVIMGTDAILLGRTTYEMLAPYWSTLENNEMGIAAKLNSVPKYVVSTTLQGAGWNNTTIIGANVVEEITRLKQQPGGDIHIEGSSTLVESLIRSRLLDELWLLVHPVIMNRGKRFFRDGTDTTRLQLLKTKTLSLGVVLLCYKVVNS